MFKFELSDMEIFKSSFDSISRIVDEVMCFVDSEGFRVSAMDKAHTTFIVLNLNPDVFDSFNFDNPMKFAVDTNELFKVLKRGKKSDRLKFIVDEGNLHIIFEGDVVKNFGIRLIDLEYGEVNVPNFDNDCTVSLSSAFMKDCLKDVSIYTDTACFVTDDTFFNIKGDGQLGEVEIVYDTCSELGEGCESRFNIEKLENIFVASKFSPDVLLGLGDNVPLKVKFLLLSEDGYLEFILAPIIEEDEV